MSDNQTGPESYLELSAVSRYMKVEAIRGNKIWGKIYDPVPENMNELKRCFAQNGATVFFEKQGDGHLLTYGYYPQGKPVKLWVNLLLLVATILTTLFVGALHAGKDPFSDFRNIISGIPFSIGIIMILGSHELAHYLVARHYGVDVTPPYFLPVPHPMTGTMGAFIKIRSPVPSKTALVRVGVAGPLTGFLVAIPVTIIGLALSKVRLIPSDIPLLRLGSPLIFELISKVLHGAPPPGFDILLHPLAFAGWLGMFVTALNLLPVGQLDGGHIAYAVLGKRYRIFSVVVIVGLLGLGIFWMGWPFWAFIATILGLRHPPPLDNITPLDKVDFLLVLLALIILIVTFTPVPFPAAGF